MLDRHQRKISYLRLSLTPACQMRCSYCRPEWLQQHRSTDLLSAREIEILVQHLVKTHGLVKVRLTGGDPTARPDLLEIIQRLAAIKEIDDLAMTTHGLTLARDAAAYRHAGLKRVNVSLDSLQHDTFIRMTGVDGLDRVLAGIDAALATGLKPLRINTVVLAGENDQELPALLRFAAARHMEIRFIELMPMGPLADQWTARYVPMGRMRASLDDIVGNWQALEQGHDSAIRFRVQLSGGQTTTVGFITPMSCNFCASCNRLRLTAEGRIYPCLMDVPRGSFLPAMRPFFQARRFDQLLQEALQGKAAEHPAQGVAIMTTLGG